MAFLTTFVRYYIKMKDILKIAICEHDIIRGDALATTKMIEPIIAQYLESNECDIMILTEFFSLGFHIGKDNLEDQDGLSLTWLKKMATDYGVAFVASIPIRIDKSDRGVNRAFFVYPDGKFNFYDKRHIFAPGGEREYISPGTSREILHFEGWNILLQVCYDLRFPVWSRSVDSEYDFVINVANWPQQRISVVDPMVRTRAIENQAYYAFSNRIGSDDICAYNGNSLISNYLGQSIEERIIIGETNFLSAEISLSALKEYNKKFPVKGDSDNFTLNI